MTVKTAAGFCPEEGKKAHGIGYEEEKNPTLRAGTTPAVSFEQNAYDKYIENEIGATIKASGGAYGGGSETLIKQKYVVRKLTPTECARLQGFPDRWGDIDRIDEMDDEQYKFWLEVRKTYDAINGRSPKEYTKESITKWYNNLHTDGAEYKMWGNGIALPCALYVMEGIESVINEGG